MERQPRDKNRLITRIIAAGLTVGGLALASTSSEQSAPSPHSVSGSTFTFPDGNKCVDGLYESPEGRNLAPDGGCAENTNEISSDITVDNGGGGGSASNTNPISPNVTITVH